MRLLLIGCLIMIAATHASELIKDKPVCQAHEQHFSLVRFSFESGCLIMGRSACSRMSNELERADCYDFAVKDCEVQSLAFRKWMENK